MSGRGRGVDDTLARWFLAAPCLYVHVPVESSRMQASHSSVAEAVTFHSPIERPAWPPHGVADGGIGPEGLEVVRLQTLDDEHGLGMRKEIGLLICIQHFDFANRWDSGSITLRQHLH